MTPRKKLSLRRNNKAKIEEGRSTNRRTSLTVNLSYISDPSLSPRNGSDENKTIDDVISSTKKRKNLSNVIETGEAEISDKLSLKIRPSFVNLTSTPIPSKYVDLLAREERRSDDRLLLQRERRLSEASTIIIQTSMDITEVQGANYDSMNFIPDTQCPEFLVGPPIPTTVIPDSQADASVDIVRASMNVNTSLDSVARLNLTENFRGKYSPEKEAETRSSRNHSTYRRGRNDSSSGSSAGNLPINSLLVTRAVIECDDRSEGSDSGRSRTDVGIANEGRTDAMQKENRNPSEINESLNNDHEREERIEPLNGTPVLGKEIRSSRLDHWSDRSSENASRSSSSSSLSSSSPLRGKNLGEIYQRIINSGLNKSRDLPGRLGEKKGKKKLMRLRASEIVDLSPVSVKQIRPAKGLIVRKRVKRRNKTAKKLDKRKSNVAKKLSDDDDEVEGARFLPRKEKKVKKVKAKKIVIKKMRDVELQKRMNKNANAMRNDSSDEGDSSDAEFQGNSLDDFEPKCNLTQRKTGGNRPKIMIVVTGLPVEEKKLVKDTVALLGSAKLQKLVSCHTTHVVSKGIRTVNLLRGIIRGCWVVSLEWISRSRGAGNWLDAEAYEMKKFSEAVEKNRREKQLFKAAYVSELFLTCGSIYISKGTSTPVSVLKELVCTAGGRVAPQAEKAKIIIGPNGLKEVWILDSITHGELQPLERYSKKKSSN